MEHAGLSKFSSPFIFLRMLFVILPIVQVFLGKLYGLDDSCVLSVSLFNGFGEVKTPGNHR